MLRDNLISWWSMDESSTGSSAVQRNDSHGANHLTDNNTVTSETGKKSNAAKFTYGNTEYLSRAGASLAGFDNIGSFSMAFWIKVPTDLGRYPAIFSLDDASAQRKILLYYDDRNATNYFNLSLFGASYAYPNDYRQKQASVVLTSTFKLAIVQYNISTDTATVYLDNNAGTTFSNVDGNGVTSSTLKNTTCPLQIGYVAHAHALDGSIDEFGFWSRLLTADERTSLYNSGNGLDYAGTSSATNVTVTPEALVLNSSLPTPTITAIRNVSVAPDVLTLTTSLPAPSVSISAQVSPEVLTLTTSLPTPIISAGGNVTVTPTALDVTISIPTPTITTESNVTVTPDVLTITSSVQEPTISLGAGVSVAVSTLTLTASLIAPTVVVEKSVEVTPSPLVLTFSILAPTKVGGTWSLIERGDDGDWSLIERGDAG